MKTEVLYGVGLLVGKVGKGGVEKSYQNPDQNECPWARCQGVKLRRESQSAINRRNSAYKQGGSRGRYGREGQGEKTESRETVVKGKHDYRLNIKGGGSELGKKKSSSQKACPLRRNSLNAAAKKRESRKKGKVRGRNV